MMTGSTEDGGDDRDPLAADGGALVEVERLEYPSNPQLLSSRG